MADIEHWSEMGLKEAYLKSMEEEILRQLRGETNMRKNPFADDLAWPISSKPLKNN